MGKFAKLLPTVRMRSPPRINPSARPAGPLQPPRLEAAPGPARAPPAAAPGWATGGGRGGHSAPAGARRAAAPGCARGLAGRAGLAHGAAAPLLVRRRASLALPRSLFFLLFFFARNKCPAAAAAAASSGASISPLAASLHMPAAPIPFTVPAPLAGSRSARVALSGGREKKCLSPLDSTGEGGRLRGLFLSGRLMLLLLSTSPASRAADPSVDLFFAARL